MISRSNTQPVGKESTDYPCYAEVDLSTDFCASISPLQEKSARPIDYELALAHSKTGGIGTTA